MALNYMEAPTHINNSLYQAITFAAPAFTETDHNVAEFVDDARILQIEVANDPVPMTWDVLLNDNRPGDVVRFSGDQTLDTNERFGNYYANANYHSMDYYRAIANNVDAESWQTILAQTGDQEVYLGGVRSLTPRTASDPQPSTQPIETFTVATNDDILEKPWGMNVFYGGEGKDTIRGGSTGELLLGGAGDDTLSGNDGRDTLVGGLGRDVLNGGDYADIFKFNSVDDSGFPDATRDVIIDFLSGVDKIDLSAIDANTSIDGNNAFSTLTMGHFANITFDFTNRLFFDTVDHILYGNNDTDATADFSISLLGVTSLDITDFIL